MCVKKNPKFYDKTLAYVLIAYERVALDYFYTVSNKHVKKIRITRRQPTVVGVCHNIATIVGYSVGLFA